MTVVRVDDLKDEERKNLVILSDEIPYQISNALKGVVLDSRVTLCTGGEMFWQGVSGILVRMEKRAEQPERPQRLETDPHDIRGRDGLLPVSHGQLLCGGHAPDDVLCQE